MSALEDIQAAFAAGESFVLEAGAGSGKTRTLIETIEWVLREHGEALERAGKSVVCITYTNVAKDEIRRRLNDDPRVVVDTIHEFLWSVCAPFQKELKLEMLEINANAPKKVDGLETVLESKCITYGMFGRHFDRGELSHDDVITAAKGMFDKYPKIVRIAADRYPFLFVDEYQDTAEEVVELLLSEFAHAVRKPVVGFYGDSMQQIYDSKVADVASTYGIRLISKEDNFRCSERVIDILNRLRTDIQQRPAGDNQVGDVHLFLQPSGDTGTYVRMLDKLAADGWTLDNTKVLVLTHKGIAREAGFSSLVEAYNKRRSFGTEILMERTEPFGKLFTLIEGLSSSHAQGKYGVLLDLLVRSGFGITSVADKARVVGAMTAIDAARSTGTIADVIAAVKNGSLIPLPDRITEVLEFVGAATEDSPHFKYKAFYEALLDVPWREVSTFVEYADEHLPFSTKHGVKGEEYENVLVVVDDGLWTKYKFADVFSGNGSNPDRVLRSKKLLYVCFSRARKGLAVLCLNELKEPELAGAVALLGVDEAEELPTA